MSAVMTQWKREKLRYLISLNSGEFITADQLLDIHEYKVFGGNGITGYATKYNIKEEVLVIGRVGAYCGNVYHVNSKSWITDNALICRTSLNYRFMYYALNMLNFNSLANKSAQPVITGTKVKNQYLDYPTIDKQKLIADFLDKSTLQIDNAIKTKQAQLKTLEQLKKSIIHKAVTKGLDDSVVLKDSGIEWIGKIPNHWNIERIKDLSDGVVGGGTPKSNIDEYWEDGNIIWMTPTDFQDFESTKYINDSQRKITELGLNKCSAKLLPINTVVMTSRASIGTPKLTATALTTNQGFISFLSSFRLSNDFLYYCIDGYLGAYFQVIASGTTFMEISPKIVKQEQIPLPTITEQQDIAMFLDKEVKKINSLKSNTQNQINKLKEYRKSLIYEYVTGKQQVKE